MQRSPRSHRAFVSTMPCALPDDLPWTAFLDAASAAAGGADALALILRDSWECSADPGKIPSDARAVLLVEVQQAAIDDRLAATASGVYRLDEHGLADLKLRPGATLDPAMATAASVYLPIILGSARARRAGESFVAGHVTQTLDGRIACENGQSQWIGNDADLRHSHRMRALLDAVMVGANTALQDDPQLDVRHVPGPDPRRVVISGRARALSAAADLKILQEPGCEVFVGAEAQVTGPMGAARIHRIAESGGALDPAAVLRALRAQDVHSIYLEGGAGVLSSFLEAGAIDVLQVHVASLVLGSGLPSLTLPVVEHVDHGLHVHMDHAILDGHVLLTCRPRA